MNVMSMGMPQQPSQMQSPLQALNQGLQPATQTMYRQALLNALRARQNMQGGFASGASTIGPAGGMGGSPLPSVPGTMVQGG